MMPSLSYHILSVREVDTLNILCDILYSQLWEELELLDNSIVNLDRLL
jgi:hypothetical protein